MDTLHLIVGLGNPGAQYADTRHNIGWQALDTLAKRHQLRFQRSERGATLASGQIGGRHIWLAKPRRYMNESGGPTRALLRHHPIATGQLIVVCDHLDLPLGHLRLRARGGAGGQKGLRDIHQKLETQEIAQLRLGIGRPPGRMDPAAYVLRPYQKIERSLQEIVLERAADALEAWLEEGIEVAMARYNGSVQEIPRAAHKCTARRASPAPISPIACD